MASSNITLPIVNVLSKTYRGSVPGCVVVNTKTYAVSEYLNYGFNSFVYFNGNNIMSGQNGIFEMDNSGLDEDSYPIVFLVKSSTIDTYAERIQRLRDSYILYSSDGDIKITTEADKRNTRRYLIPRNSDIVKTVRKRRIKFERGIKDRYFNFKIENVNGSSIGINKFTVELEPVISKRR
ncbi:MAG: hypothetical protein GY718_09810 [Lentisphaerae bacterium]|nr:hypothetical protein [Lentisphaerota bacterium]